MSRPASRPELSAEAARVCGNAARLRVEAPALAIALDLAAPLPGRRWCPRCVWCAEREDPTAEAPSYRPPRGGDCYACPVSGHDVVVIALPCGPEIVLDVRSRP